MARSITSISGGAKESRSQAFHTDATMRSLESAVCVGGWVGGGGTTSGRSVGGVRPHTHTHTHDHTHQHAMHVFQGEDDAQPKIQVGAEGVGGRRHVGGVHIERHKHNGQHKLQTWVSQSVRQAGEVAASPRSAARQPG